MKITMKKTFALLAFVVITVVSQAQTEKGTWLLGGNISFTQQEDQSYFNLSPDLGYFIAPNVAVGIDASLNTGEGYTSWAIGPFGRYYFTQNTQGKPFAGLSFLVGGFTSADTYTGFGAEAGYALFLNRSVALEFGLQYQRMEELDIIQAGVGLQIHFKK